MQLKQIHTADTTYFSFIEKVLVDSFPSNEYRDLKDFESYTDTNSLFHNNIIYEKERLVGFITYWNFIKFCYVEHFAIEKSMRGKGYGAFSLFLLKKIINCPIILEVELPLNRQALRRIEFYRRQGFKLWNNYYEQPPYRPVDNAYPMQLMVYGNDFDKVNFQDVRRIIYREVYGV